MTLSEMGALASLALNIGIAIVGATWGVAKIKDAVRDAMDAHRREFDDDLASVRREVGESILAVRSKIHEMELWARDTFVRRDSFLAVIGEVKSSVGELGSRIEKRLERMEIKIDNAASKPDKMGS